MERREEIQQRVDDNLLGRQTAAEQQAFREDMAQDEALRQTYEDTRSALDAIEASEDQALKQRLQQLEKKLTATDRAAPALTVVREDAPEAKVVPFYRRHFYAMAASLLFLLAAGYFILMPSTTDNAALYAANFEPYRNIAVDLTRSNDPTPEQSAFTTYENGDYRAALNQLNALVNDPVYTFYASQAHLALGEHEQAIALLSPLSTSMQFPLRQQAGWFLALAQLGNGNADEATRILQTIAADVNHPFQQQAADLLAELD